MPRVGLFACLLVIAGMAVAEVPTIHCPADPPTVRTVELVERLRIDAEDEDAPLIGLVSLVRTPEAGGDLYFLDRQLCQVLVFTADGEFLDILGHEGEGPGEFEPYRRTADDKDEISNSLRIVRNGERQKIEYHLLDTEPAILKVEARPDGTVLVSTCYTTRDLPDGVVARYDIHGPEGVLLEELRITGDCDLDYDALRLLPDGRAVVLRNYQSAIRAMRNVAEESDNVREDATFEVVVFDLVDVS